MTRIIGSRVPFVVVLTLCLLRPIGGQAQARAPLVQSVDVQIPAPPTPVMIAGKRHLVYELHVTNFRPFDVALVRVEVSDAARKRRLGDFSDSALVARVGRVGARADSADKRVIAAGGRAVVYLWLALDDGVPAPRELQHRLELDLVSPTGRVRTGVDAGTTAVRAQPPPALNAPLRGGPWAAVYDPALARGHRTSFYTIGGRARIPGRFAIDWIRLDDDANTARGDASRIANWHGYGAEVLAVADGVVSAANDDMPESDVIATGAPAPIAPENASGNYVTLDLGGGRYAFYEHLKHGSIAVRVGDRVKSGQVIARLGNSGSSSSGPHLHFHVSDASSTLAAEGLPYVFKSFEVLGVFETINAVGSGRRWRPLSGDVGRMRAMELPDANVVVMFDSVGR